MRLLASLLLVAGLVASSSAPAQERAAPTRAQVQQAVEQLKRDPDLAGKRQQKTLRFKDLHDDQPPKPAPRLQWLIDLFRWVADTSRFLMWALGAVAVALLLVGLRHWIRWRGGAPQERAADLPSHVRDLDIRRESLPADIGTAARTLWERGQARGALSLLYRGALSRLVHRHSVPILGSSTEEECVRLAARTLARPDSDFMARLVQAWQLTVYGSRLPDGTEVLALCAGFDAHLGRHDPAPVPAGQSLRPLAQGPQ